MTPKKRIMIAIILLISIVAVAVFAFLSVKEGDEISPIADAGGDQTLDFGEEVYLNGEGSFDNVGIVRYIWDLGNGTEKEGMTLTYTYTEPGVYEVTLTVRDEVGNEGNDVCTVTVVDGTPPVATIWTNSIHIGEGEYVEFSAVNSTDNVGVSSYQWDFGDETTGSGQTIIHSFPNVGNFTVTLTVADEAGNHGVATIGIEVHPVIIFP